LTTVSVSPATKGMGDGFADVTIGRHGTCIVDVAASLSDDGVRIAIGCVGPTPVRAPAMEAKLQGSDLGEHAVRDAAQGLGATLDPPSDVHGSADYRRALAETLAVRAVLQAASRRKA
jgi:aerobic carbon-monoxide dehydrogenase medium subunit